MKLLLPVLLFSFLLSGSPACKEVKKTGDPAGINILIQDLPCAAVLERIQKALTKHTLPFVWLNKDQGLLSVGPIITSPFPEEPYKMMEEKFQMEIKCRDPLRTRITLGMELKGSTPTGRWEEIKDPATLNAYSKRFWDGLNIP
jgi:hypothetical protein